MTTQPVVSTRAPRANLSHSLPPSINNGNATFKPPSSHSKTLTGTSGPTKGAHSQNRSQNSAAAASPKPLPQISPSAKPYQSPLIKRKLRQQRITQKPNYNPYVGMKVALDQSNSSLSSTFSPTRIALSHTPHRVQERSRLESLDLKMYSSFSKSGTFDEARLMGGYRGYESLWEKRGGAKMHDQHRQRPSRGEVASVTRSPNGGTPRRSAQRSNSRRESRDWDRYSLGDDDGEDEVHVEGLERRPSSGRQRRPQSARHGGGAAAVRHHAGATAGEISAKESATGTQQQRQYENGRPALASSTIHDSTTQQQRSSPRRQWPPQSPAHGSFFPTEVKVSSRLEYSLLERSGELDSTSGGTPMRHHHLRESNGGTASVTPAAAAGLPPSQRKRPFSASVIIGSAHKRGSFQQQPLGGTPVKRRPMSASATKGRDPHIRRRSSVVRTMGFSRGSTPRGMSSRGDEYGAVDGSRVGLYQDQ